MAALNKRILLTGSTGLLGLSFIRHKATGFDIYAGYYNFPKEALPKLEVKKYLLFNIRTKKEVFDIFNDIKPDIVIHAASIGNVDYCEKNKEEARGVNVEGSRNVIEACRQHNSKIIFTSSNAVFDGSNPPYSEEAKPNPVDYYGQTKLQTESDIRASGLKYAIARLMTMYGWNHPLERQNPVTWVLEKFNKGQKINIVDDIYNNHLFADNANEAIWAIISGNKEGIYHIAGSEVISRYELVCKVADVFGFDKNLVIPVNSSFFPSIAPRPKNTSYNITRMEKGLGVKGIGIWDGLELMKKSFPVEWNNEWR